METNLLYSVSFLIFMLLIITFIILSFILNYHWNKYEISNKQTILIKTIYFGVSIILILILLSLFMNLK